MTEALLNIQGLHRSFGGVHAVNDVSFQVSSGLIKAGHRTERCGQDHPVQPDRRHDPSGSRRSQT